MGEARRKKLAGAKPGYGWIDRTLRIPRELDDLVKQKFGEDASRLHIYERALTAGLTAMMRQPELAEDRGRLVRAASDEEVAAVTAGSAA